MTDTKVTHGNETLLLKSDTRGRVRTPKERREALLAEYARSGMSGQAFARWAGLKYPTFASWVQQRRKAAPDAVTWVEAQVSEPVKGLELVIELPGKARLVVNGIGQVPLTVALLRQLGAAC